MRTVLAIDDEQDILLMIKISLEFDDWRVITAPTGEEGLEVAARERPDLILLDIRLPGMDGWEVLDRLQRDGGLAPTPVVMVSAHATPSTPKRAIEAGCRAYLTKPFLPAELRKVVSDATATG